MRILRRGSGQREEEASTLTVPDPWLVAAVELVDGAAVPAYERPLLDLV